MHEAVAEALELEHVTRRRLGQAELEAGACAVPRPGDVRIIAVEQEAIGVLRAFRRGAVVPRHADGRFAIHLGAETGSSTAAVDGSRTAMTFAVWLVDRKKFV